MTFGDRIKHFRELCGLTQEQLALEIGVAKTTITGYEKGNRQPDVEKIKRLAYALHVSGNELLGIELENKNAPPQSEEALKLAEDYAYHMDDWGRKTVRTVADFEIARTREEQAAQKAFQQKTSSHPASEFAPEKVLRFVVPEYSSPMSAGTGHLSIEESPENLHLIVEPPRGTSYIATVRGDSMEPTFYDGDKLFIRACDTIRQGDIGVFLMGGKQWVKELGDGILISHNQEYPPIPIADDTRCQGLVLGICNKSYFE